MKGNELIEKILNKEIKSGTLINMKSNYPGLEWEKTLCFNGNWFSEEKYYPGIPRYDDIILELCSEYITFEIIEEEKKKPEKLGYFDLTKDKNKKDENGDDLELHYTGVADTFDDVYEKINEIIDYLDYLKSKGDE